MAGGDLAAVQSGLAHRVSLKQRRGPEAGRGPGGHAGAGSWKTSRGWRGSGRRSRSSPHAVAVRPLRPKAEDLAEAVVFQGADAHVQPGGRRVCSSSGRKGRRVWPSFAGFGARAAGAGSFQPVQLLMQERGQRKGAGRCTSRRGLMVSGWLKPPRIVSSMVTRVGEHPALQVMLGQDCAQRSALGARTFVLFRLSGRLLIVVSGKLRTPPRRS